MTLLLFLSICLVNATVSAANEPAAVDSLLIVSADSTLDFSARRDALKAATKLDKTGRSDAALAELYLQHPSASRMVSAEHAIKRAIKKDRKNPEYVGLMSRYMWQIGRRGSSQRYANQAIKVDPVHPIGHYWSGRYHFWETMKYLWMSRVEVNQDSWGRERAHQIDLGPWGEEARVKAETAFEQVLNLDPGHEAARRYLGLIYYQTRRSQALRELFKPALSDRPDDPTGYFTVGMSYHLDKDYDRAYRAYNTGLHKMSEAEQRFMLAVFTDARTDTITEVPDMQTLQRFWAGKNPLFMSSVNERLLEQCRRVAYVNLRYGEPEKGIAGWTTDRGQAYIRFGDPLALQARPPEIDTGLDDPIIMQQYRFNDAKWFGTSSDQYEFGKELWEYENFVLVFDNTDTRDSWKFRIASLDGAIIGLDDLVERVPERFVDPFGDRRFPVSHQVAQFRGKAGKSRVEIYYAVPASRVESETKKGLGTVDLKKGLFVFDSNWDTLNVEKNNVKRLAWVKDKGFKNGYLLSGEILNLKPGRYHVAGEVVDQATESVGGFRSELPVRSFAGQELQISSILLARRVIEKPERPFGRGRYVVLPNPTQATPRNRKAYFYFEVYNLSRDAFGRTSYKVTYQTKRVATQDFDDISEWETAVTQEVAGDHPWEPVYLALDLASAQPGLRDFRVIIEDKLSNQTATGVTQHRIRW